MVASSLAKTAGQEQQIAARHGSSHWLYAKQKRWDEGVGYQKREVFEAFFKLLVVQRKVVHEVILAFVKADEAGG